MYQLHKSENPSIEADLDGDVSRGQQLCPLQDSSVVAPTPPSQGGEPFHCSSAGADAQQKGPRKLKIVSSPKSAHQADHVTPRSSETNSPLAEEACAIPAMSKAAGRKPKPDKRSLRKRPGRGYVLNWP